jgi:hypothetical protein
MFPSESDNRWRIPLLMTSDTIADGVEFSLPGQYGQIVFEELSFFISSKLLG